MDLELSKEYHVNFLEAAMESISEINRDKNLSMICKLNVTHLKGGWGDFFYFPSKDGELFMRLEDIFWKIKAFLENTVASSCNVYMLK